MLGLYLEEIEISRVVELGKYTFTREAILEFAVKFDPQPFHLDNAAAAIGPFGKLSASGWHTAAGWMNCYVASNTAARVALTTAGKSLPELGASPGFENMRWLRPVYPGDTITYRITVNSKRNLVSRPQWGLLFALGEGFNQDGVLVFSFESKVLTALMPVK